MHLDKVSGAFSERIADEAGAQIVMRVERPALLTFSSDNVTNAMGYPTAYQLIFPNIRALVTSQGRHLSTRGFLRTCLGHARQNAMNCSLPVSRSTESARMNGIIELYTSDNESIENTDLVAWPTIGFHHVPMAEDWPVMPAKVDEIVLKPRNFFDHNPAIDLPTDPSVGQGVSLLSWKDRGASVTRDCLPKI